MSKIFVSYKHADSAVQRLPGVGLIMPMTARRYVDHLDTILTERHGHIYKGEDSGESLAGYSEEYIQQLLSDRMFDSSVTVILITKNMREAGRSENDQWIPWEISYSLQNKTREDRTSTPNALIGLVVPDENGSYEHFVRAFGCTSGCENWGRSDSFEMISKNMFNRNQKKQLNCVGGHNPHTGDDHSYMVPVRWGNFINNPDYYIDLAKRNRDNLDDFDLKVRI